MTDRFAAFPDLSLHFNVCGQGDRSLVLFHELSGTLESWDLVLPAFTTDFRILRADQRGAGLSEKVRRCYALQDLVSDAERLIEAAGLKPPFYLGGVASGAATAVAFASRHGDETVAVALCSPALGADPARRSYLTARADKAVEQGMRSIADAVFANSCPADSIKDPRVYEEYRGRFYAIDPICYGFANRVLCDATEEKALLALRCPVLLLAGRHDVMRPPAYVQGLAQGRDNIEVGLVESAHIMILQAPTEVGTQMLGFFDRARNVHRSSRA